MLFDESPVLVTIDELCSMLKIGKNSAYKLLSSGQIKAFKVGRIWKIPYSSIATYIHNKSTSSASKS